MDSSWDDHSRVQRMADLELGIMVRRAPDKHLHQKYVSWLHVKIGGDALQRSWIAQGIFELKLTVLAEFSWTQFKPK